MSKGRKPENLTGMRFGNLTVLRSAPDRVYKCGTVEKGGYVGVIAETKQK